MPKENKIRILYVQPGKYPEERIIDNTLKAYQSLVYGDDRAGQQRHRLRRRNHPQQRRTSRRYNRKCRR